MRSIWARFELEKQNTFTKKYGDIALLLSVSIDEQLIRVTTLFLDLSYRCFTFNKKDMTPTIKEYSTLLHLELTNLDKIFYKELKKFGY